MRYGQAQSYDPYGKMEIIRLVENSRLSVKATLKELGVRRSTFYEWYRKYQESGYDGLAASYRRPPDALGGLPPVTFREQKTAKISTYELST